jgi:hypothetical protein
MEIDLTQVDTIAINAPHFIEFAIFKDDSEEVEFSKSSVIQEKPHITNDSNKACFAYLGTAIQKYKTKYNENPNRLVYRCYFKKHQKEKLHLSQEERERWISLCKEHKFMPDYIGDYFIKNGDFTIKLDKCTLSELYVYLNMARYIQEVPFFVRAVFYFMDSKNMGFLTAFSVSSTLCIVNAGHHVLPISRSYGVVKEFKEPVDFSYISALFILMQKMGVTKDAKKVTDVVVEYGYRFELLKDLNNICSAKPKLKKEIVEVKNLEKDPEKVEERILHSVKLFKA